MPEHSEVRIIAENLKKFVDKEVKAVKWIGNHPKVDHFIIESLRSEWDRWKAIHCKGKVIWIELNGPDNFLLCRLGMTGGFSTIEEKHSHLEFKFSDGSLFFNDIRKFGSLRYVFGADLDKVINSLGWDPIRESKSWNQINWGRPNDSICKSLMDQSKFAGVGNYIKSEALYQAKIHPETKIKDLSQKNKENIMQAIKDIINKSYQFGGNSLKNWKDINSTSGEFSKELKVYGKKFDPNGKPIFKSRTSDGRTSWWANYG